jgi:hypothetical protein
MLRLRVIFLWALMAAVPLQGYAAASMAFCASMGGGVTSIARTAREHAPGHPQKPKPASSKAGSARSSEEGDFSDADPAHKCDNCSTCQAIALTTDSLIFVPLHLPKADLAEPLGIFSATVLQVLDKPPRI